ncbi:signal peptidase I [Mesobacillus subterraneus]|uniref:signal peptidase I n=1 Tax=Mesobacillus subterraneus TaxID=285983 RepID=UPI003EB9D8CD
MQGVLEMNPKKELISWIKSLMLAIILALFMRTYLFSPYIVEGASMEPTLHNQEKIFVNKLGTSNDLKRGDIVIIKGKGENYVKRVIGFPGEKIEMKNDELYINKEIMRESYLTANLHSANKSGSKLTGDFGPLVVPEGHLFVMGDNRLHSMDSRNGLGYIKKSSIVGKSEIVFLPVKNIRKIK